MAGGVVVAGASPPDIGASPLPNGSDIAGASPAGGAASIAPAGAPPPNGSDIPAPPSIDGAASAAGAAAAPGSAEASAGAALPSVGAGGAATAADCAAAAMTWSPERSAVPSATDPGTTSAIARNCSTLRTFSLAITSLPRLTSKSALANTPPEFPLSRIAKPHWGKNVEIRAVKSASTTPLR